jgi:hypothetical protein
MASDDVLLVGTTADTASTFDFADISFAARGERRDGDCWCHCPRRAFTWLEAWRTSCLTESLSMDTHHQSSAMSSRKARITVLISGSGGPHRALWVGIQTAALTISRQPVFQGPICRLFWMPPEHLAYPTPR